LLVYQVLVFGAGVRRITAKVVDEFQWHRQSRRCSENGRSLSIL